MIIPPFMNDEWMRRLYSSILAGFDEMVLETSQWLESPTARDFYFNQGERLSTFFESSGINDRWQEIINRRAKMGADITEEIYEYARSVNMEDHLIPYTATEKLALNRLCDYNYELIRNVCTDEVMAIRRKLIQDYAEGVNPLQTHLKELQLEPINGWSPEQRAEVIARTESARTLNVSTLETMRNNGVEYVTLYGCDPSCEECAQYLGERIPIEEALNIEVPHPNCHGVWVRATQDNIDEIQAIIEAQLAGQENTE